METTVLIHYAEIGLKKGNRGFFEKKLIENIKGKLKKFGELRVENLRGRIIVALPCQGIKKDQIKKGLAKVFGVSWFAFVEKTESEINKIETLVKKSAKKISSKESFAIRVKRVDKNFPLQSIKAERILGRAVQETIGSEVNLSNPDKTLFVEINKGETFVFWEKIRGLGGLPVGASGKLICLFSGGIDSAVAAYLLAKRGAEVILLHFSAVSTSQVKKSKIIKIHKKLEEFIGKTRLYIVPYTQFQTAVLDLSGRAARYEVLLFRRFMRKVAEKIAEKEKAQALVTGDNLGQVASQTLENLAIFDKETTLPVFRPLLGFDKQEIIDFAKKIGTYELSIVPYKDCCSIIQKNPATRGKWEIVERLEKEIEMEKIVEKSLAEIAEL